MNKMETEDKSGCNPAIDAGDYLIQILFDGNVARQLYIKGATVRVIKVSEDSHLIATV